MSTHPDTYVCLLRGINVGGNNIIKMADLRAAFVDLGFGDVQTYIQSGNVVFSADDTSTGELTALLERELGDRFAYSSRVAVVTADDVATAVAEAPAGFGTEPDTYRYDVMFVLDGTTPVEVLAAIESLPPREGVDEVWAGSHAVYHRRLTERASQSRLSKIVQTSVYPHITIRNWNTTTKLHAITTTVA